MIPARALASAGMVLAGALVLPAATLAADDFRGGAGTDLATDVTLYDDVVEIAMSRQPRAGPSAYDRKPRCFRNAQPQRCISERNRHISCSESCPVRRCFPATV